MESNLFCQSMTFYYVTDEVWLRLLKYNDLSLSYTPTTSPSTPYLKYLLVVYLLIFCCVCVFIVLCFDNKLIFSVVTKRRSWKDDIIHLYSLRARLITSFFPTLWNTHTHSLSLSLSEDHHMSSADSLGPNVFWQIYFDWSRVGHCAYKRLPGSQQSVR